MKRRELIKSSVLLGSLSGVAALSSGCQNQDSEYTENDKLKIIPKQTGVYQFSTPLTFDHKNLDKLATLNQEYKKSQIETLYNAIPWPWGESFNELFQTKRGENPEINSFDVFAKYVKHAFDNGFKVCYLLNSPKTFNDKDAAPHLPKLYKLLDDLYEIGVRNIKIANTQVAEIVRRHNSDFKFTASTVFEYHNISQYKNLIDYMPNIERIIIAKDENQNFKLLHNLKKLLPNITIEMMLDEGCIKSCPSRIFCMADSETTKIGNQLGCEILKKCQSLRLFKTGQIFPWQLPYYSALGINHFKNVQKENRAVDKDNEALERYMDIVEYGRESKHFEIYVKGPFRNYNMPDNIDVDTLLSFYPDVEFFIKHGHECTSKCQVSCTYCYQKAQELDLFARNMQQI